MTRTKFVRDQTNSHWYTREGVPLHEVPRASGEGMRPTDVRDAKRLGLLPSVTNILGGLAKPGIDAWKRNQLVSAALALPRLEGEPDADYAARLIEQAEAPSIKGSDFGTRLHQGIEDWLRSSGELWPEDAPG